MKKRNVLYNTNSMKKLTVLLLGGIILVASSFAAIAYDERTIAVIETRPGDDTDVTVMVDTLKPISIIVSFR